MLQQKKKGKHVQFFLSWPNSWLLKCSHREYLPISWAITLHGSTHWCHLIKSSWNYSERTTYNRRINFKNERIIKNFLSAVTCKRYTSKISWRNKKKSRLILTNCLLFCLLLGCSVFIWPIIEDWCSAAAESFPEIHFLSLFSLGEAAIGLRTHHTSLDLNFNIWTPAIGNLGLTFQTKSSAQY